MDERGKIIPFPPPEERPKKDGEQEQGAPHTSEVTPLHPETEVPDRNQLTRLIEFLTALAESDPRSLNRTNIAERRTLLAGATNQKVVRVLHESTKADWQQRPSYFHALIAELRDRHLV